MGEVSNKSPCLYFKDAARDQLCLSENQHRLAAHCNAVFPSGVKGDLRGLLVHFYLHITTHMHNYCNAWCS